MKVKAIKTRIMSRVSDSDHQAMEETQGRVNMGSCHLAGIILFFPLPLSLKKKKKQFWKFTWSIFFQDSEQEAIFKKHSVNPFHAVNIFAGLRRPFNTILPW